MPFLTLLSSNDTEWTMHCIWYHFSTSCFGVSLYKGKWAERTRVTESDTWKSAEDFRVKSPWITDSRLMDVQQSCGYYWTQGDFCRAIFSVLSTGTFSYLVHLVEWGDETFQKWLKLGGKQRSKPIKNDETYSVRPFGVFYDNWVTILF